MWKRNCIIGVLILTSFSLKSCGTLYVDEDRQDCHPNLVGKWKIYKIRKALRIPSNEKDFKVWVIDSNTIKIQDIRTNYLFKGDCSHIVLMKNKETDGLHFKIQRIENDTLILRHYALPHESTLISFKRIN